MHNLHSSFNVIVTGCLRNNDSGQVHNQFAMIADYPILINLNLRDQSDQFTLERMNDRLNFEALEDTVILRIASTHVTEPIEKKVMAMKELLATRIKI